MADFKSVHDVGNLKTRITTSRFSGEIKHGSTLAFDDNTKFDDADTRSSDRGASTRPASVKSEISTETNLPIGNGIEMFVEKTHDSQCMTESSCSNSLPVVRPFSNQRYQETFKEAYLFRNYGSSMDSSSSKAFDQSPEEPVTASSESGVSAQISNMAIRNAKAINDMKISLTAENHCLFMMKKGDEEISCKWDHGTTSPVDDVGEVLEQIDNLDSFNCTSKTAESTRLRHGHENLSTSHFGERTEYNISREGGKTLENDPQVMKNEKKFIAGFDLNEDINANVLDDYIQPVLETASSHRVIHVLAKSGIPIGQPMIPLKFEGGLGWKGSAQTSAFRPASPSKNPNRKIHSTYHESKDEQCFTGIDLNVAAIEDKTQSEVEAKSLSIDLNRLYDAAPDDFTQPSFPPISQNRPWVDLNLSSDKSLADKCKNVHSSYPGKKELDFAGHDYWANFSTMQRCNNTHTLFPAPNFLQPVEMMRREGPTQPKLPFLSHTIPPQSFSYKDPFHHGVGSIPYTRYYDEHASFNAPHLGRVVLEQSSSNISASIGKLDNKNEDNLSISGSRMEDSRQFPFLARNSPMADRMHQEAWYAASMKRKEPEGGLECYQLGYKQNR